MKITDLLNEDKVTLSFEVFPPKTSSKYENVLKAAEKIASLNPSFMLWCRWRNKCTYCCTCERYS